MGKLFHRTLDGVAVRLNRFGDEIEVKRDSSMRLDNVSGAAVVLSVWQKANSAHLTFDTTLPESEIPFRWIFEFDGDSTYQPPLMAASNLEDLVGQLRCAMGG